MFRARPRIFLRFQWAFLFGMHAMRRSVFAKCLLSVPGSECWSEGFSVRDFFPLCGSVWFGFRLGDGGVLLAACLLALPPFEGFGFVDPGDDGGVEAREDVADLGWAGAEEFPARVDEVELAVG